MIGAFIDSMEKEDQPLEQRVAEQRHRIMEYLVVTRDVPEGVAAELLSKMTDDQVMTQGKNVAETIETASNAIKANPQLNGNLGPHTIKKLFNQAKSLADLRESSFVAGIVLARSDGAMPDMTYPTKFQPNFQGINESNTSGQELFSAPKPNNK